MARRFVDIETYQRHKWLTCTATCSNYLCPDTLACVHFPHHCPCQFSDVEDKVELADGIAICASKGGWKEGETFRKIELARKGLIWRIFLRYMWSTIDDWRSMAMLNAMWTRILRVNKVPVDSSQSVEGPCCWSSLSGCRFERGLLRHWLYNPGWETAIATMNNNECFTVDYTWTLHCSYPDLYDKTVLCNSILTTLLLMMPE